MTSYHTSSSICTAVILLLVLIFTFIGTSMAFDQDEAQLIQNMHDRLTADWADVNVLAQAFVALYQLQTRLDSKQSQLAQQNQNTINAMNNAQTQVQTALNGGNQQQYQQAVTNFQTLQQQYGPTLSQMSQYLQLWGAEAEVAEDLELAVKRIEVCVTRASLMDCKAKSGQQFADSDLRDLLENQYQQAYQTYQQQLQQYQQNQQNGQQQTQAQPQPPSTTQIMANIHAESQADITKDQQSVCESRATIVVNALQSILDQYNQQQQQAQQASGTAPAAQPATGAQPAAVIPVASSAPAPAPAAPAAAVPVQPQSVPVQPIQ